MVCQLELLSNELLLDIMEYLDAYTLIKAFHGLNYRLNSLLRLCHVHLCVNSDEYNKEQWNQSIPYFEQSQIRSLEFREPPYYVDISGYYVPEKCCNLRSVTIAWMNHRWLKHLFEDVLVLNQIRTLKVDGIQPDYEDSDNCPSILDTIFNQHGHRFTSLINCALTNLGRYNGEYRNISNIFPHLRRYIIFGQTLTQDLRRFLHESTPNLRTLGISLSSYMSDEFFSKDVIKHVRELGILPMINYSNLGRLLLMFPSLQRLHIQSDCYRDSILDGVGWQKILENHLPDIQQLTIDFIGGVSEEVAKTFYTNEFWLRKKVVTKMVTDKNRKRRVETIYFGQLWRLSNSEALYYGSW